MAIASAVAALAAPAFANADAAPQPVSLTADINGNGQTVPLPPRSPAQGPEGDSKMKCEQVDGRRVCGDPGAQLFPGGYASGDTPIGLRLNAGQTATIKGSLYDHAGAPIAGATITIQQRTDTTDATTASVGRATTDGDGSFSFTLPAGVDRVVDVTYAGDADNYPAALTIPVWVANPSTLASRRVGQTFELSGHVDVIRGITDHAWVQILEYERDRANTSESADAKAGDWKVAATLMTQTDSDGDWHTTVAAPDAADLSELGFSALVGEVEDTKDDDTLVQPDSPWAPALLGSTTYHLTVTNNSNSFPDIVVYQAPTP